MTKPLFPISDFEDVTFPAGASWVVSAINGWSGSVEIQRGNVAELDTDNRQSSVDKTPSDHASHPTTITSDPMEFIPGMTYTLDFSTWNRSGYAEDNMVCVTVPGTIVSAGGMSYNELWSNIELSQGAVWDEPYGLVFLTPGSLTFSAGGAMYRETSTSTDDISGLSGWSCSTITFVATAETGTISFSDASTMQVMPSLGPNLDNVSMNTRYVIADIDVDSNNDGVIDAYDDPIEMKTHGMVVSVGTSFGININSISNSLLSSEMFGARIVSSNPDVVAGLDMLDISTSVINYTGGTSLGSATLTYEVYSKLTNITVARDMVNITIISIGIQPYTPETIHVDPMPIPEEKWKVNGVGIRRNADFDYGGASTTPDYKILGETPRENDLIKAYVSFVQIEGIEYSIETSSDHLKFWKSSTKSEPYNFVDNSCVLIGPGNIWAEYASEGDASYTLTLVARDSDTKNELLRKEIVFRPFNSITCAFVGEFQTAGLMDANHGVNLIVRDLLLDGYDVHVWDDGHDWWSWDEADEWGRGPAYDTIVNAVNNHGQSNVALFGYSHGGGTVYNVAWRMHNNYADSKGKNMAKQHSLVFTSYIDAVCNAYFLDISGEDRRPLNSQYHLNQFQENDYFVDGCTSNGTADEEIDRSSILGMTHAIIDDNMLVRDLLKTKFISRIVR